MRDKAHRYLTLAIVLLAVLAVTAPQTVLGTTPRPVVAVPAKEEPVGPPAPEKWQQELPPIIPPKEEESGNEPDKPGPQDDLDCFVGGPRPLTAVAQGTTGMPLLLAGYPGPVIPVKVRPAKPPCRTDLSLSLKVESPKNEKPDGANATVEGRWFVPRRSLESGARAEMPAGDRTISLDHPGEEWELKAVACTCQGEAGGSVALSAIGLSGPLPAGETASYPGPVVAVPGGSATAGSAKCEAAASTAATSPSLAVAISGGALPGSSLTMYPRPVVPVPKPAAGGEPAPTPAPAPPARGPGAVSWDKHGTIDVSDPKQAGAIIDCTWTVEHVYGRVTVRTVTKPTGAESTIDYLARPVAVEGNVWPRGVTGSASGTQHLLRHGDWSLAPSTVKDGWEVVESKCQESDSGKRTAAQGASAQLGVDVGDDITCTFRWKLITPKEGPWTAVNMAGTATCSAKGGGSVRIPFGEERGTGRIVHQNEGDRLKMTGKGPGLIPVTVDRDPDDPRRYRGTVTRTFSGAKAKFTFTYKVVSEKKMNGSLTATWKQGGNKCVFKRKITLTYGKKK